MRLGCGPELGSGADRSPNRRRAGIEWRRVRTLDAERLVGRRYRTYKFIYRFCKQERMEPERFWALPFDRLRFKLGESFRNLKVPFATAPALTHALTEALDELLALAGQRHLGGNTRVVAPEIEESALCPPLSYALDEAESPALHERVIAGVLAFDSWLDPALLRGWLGEPGRGSALVRQLAAAYRKAFVEERALVRTEPTTYLTQLAVLRHLLPFWNDRIAASGTAAFADRMEIASAVVLHAFFDEMIHAAFENPVLVDSTLIDVRAEYLLKTSCSPLTFLRDPATVLRTEANPYGFSAEIYTEAVALWRGFDPLRQDLDGMVDLATREMAKHEELVAAAVESAWLGELKRHITAALSEDRAVDDAAGEELAALAADPKLLRQQMRSRVARGQVVSTLDGAEGSDARKERFAALAAHMLGAEKLKKDPAKAFGRAVVHESLLRETVRAVAVFQLDLTTRQIVERTASLLLDRRMEDRTVVIAAEYDAGRIYRIAGDDHPILRAETTREEGHLFLDLKDFTKKTHSLKELNMADFLKGEFYGPLLRLARELAIENGPNSIALNNLLGDAISFSGGVRTLVDFAERAAESLDGYREKLKTRMPESIVRGELKRLERQYDLEKGRISDKRVQLEAILKGLSAKFGSADGEKTGVFAPGAGLIGEVTEATNALYRLEEREAQLERELAEKEEFLTGGDLVAGVFLSWGAPATVLKITDPVFGDVKVAIAEKINEAARGTARNLEVKRRLDMRVREERERTGAPSLEYPFRVYIDKIWNLTVPPWMSESFRKAIEDKDPIAAGRVFNEAGRAALAELTANASKKGPLSLTTVYANQDVYNAGVALSEQALGAYQKVAGKKHPFFVKTVNLSELGEEFHERFAFDTRRLRFVFVAGATASAPPRQVFRYAGSMVFRGFEQRTAVGVYELLNPRDAFWRLLVERHFGAWYKSLREKKGGGARAFEPTSDEEPTDPRMRGDV